MVDANYPPNSHKSRETPNDEKKVVKKVITGDVLKRKKPLGRRIAETFTGEDAHSVGHYLLFEVFIPAAKTMLADAASQGAERLLFGEVRRVGSRSSGNSRNYTSYNRMSSSSRDRDEPRRELSRQARSTHNFDEVVLEDRGEAEQVIDSLQAIVDQYDVVTVADLFELVGITGSYTDNKWGWYDLRGAGVRRVRDGYLLELPRTSPIE